VRSISREHKAQCFRLFQALAWSNSHTSNIMYYAIEIGYSLFLSGSFWGDVLDVDLSSLFVVGEPPHKV
jgi:hypothetical protein